MGKRASELPLDIIITVAEFLPICDLAQFIQAIPVVGKLLHIRRLQRHDENGDTILHFIAEAGYDNLILLFGRAFEPLHVPNYGGMTPLHKAVDGSHYTTVNLLLETGSSVSALDNRNESPLHHSMRTRTKTSGSIIRLLLSRTADPSLPNIDGFTPLHEAVLSHQPPEIVQLLIDTGADVNTKAGRQRWTPIFYAVRFTHETPGEVLASVGADLDKSQEEDQDDLFSRQRGMDIVNVLLRAQADLSVCDSEGRTVLMETARLGADDAMKLLLKAGASVHQRDGHLRTALCHAVMRGNRSTVKRLIEAGADVWNRDDSGRNVVDLAFWYGHDELAKVLQRAQRIRPWGRLRDRTG